MQDRFKFRLYDKAIGEMVYDVCVGFIKDSGKTDDWVCADTSCGQITYRDDKLKDIILMHCTGLKDKNGKLIYEVDIVKDLTYSYNVRYLCVFAPIFGGLGLISIQNWKDYNFCRENWEDYYSNSEVRRLDNRFKLANQGNKLRCFSMRELKMNDFEVIGNIYENPELMEVK